MKLSGWTTIEDCMPWAKVFDVDISCNIAFSHVPIDKVTEAFVACDLNGFVKNADALNGMFDVMLDGLLRICGVDIKDAYVDRRNVCYNGHKVRCHDDAFHSNVVDVIGPSADANVTLIDNMYVYFNYTSYKFYEPYADDVANTFGYSNLGGWLVKLGQHRVIDLLVKDII